MNPFLERTGLVLWYIAWPFWKTLQLIYFLLKPLRYTLHILSLPFVYLSLFIYKAVRWPFDFLAKFEDLYIYLSVAIVIGAITGLFVYAVYSTLLPILGLTVPSIEDSKPKRSFAFPPSSNASDGALPKPQMESSLGRTVADFRAERRRKKGQITTADLDAELSSTSQLLSSESKGKWQRRGMLESPTILEEDSDF